MRSDVPALPDKIDHIGVVVKDVDKTLKFLSSIWELGFCPTVEYTAPKDDLLAGEPFRLKIIFVNLGSISLELLQPLEEESLWSRFLATHGEGVNHIAFTVSNWDETVAKFQEHGCRMVVGARYKGKRWGYFETRPGGIMVEFQDNYGIHNSDELEKLIE